MPPGRPIEVRELAAAACELAVQAGDHILEAEALLSVAHGHANVVHPGQVLAGLESAGRIFVANGLARRAAECRLAAASALCDAGEEAECMRLAERALAEASLPAEARIHAHVLIAMASLHVGNIDAALRRIDTVAEPLARAAPIPTVLARVLWAKALGQVFLLIARHLPRLWYPLTSQPAATARALPLDRVLALLDSAEALLPPDRPWAYIAVCRCFLQALFRADEAAAARLFDIAARSAEFDPPLAVRSLLCLVLVRRREERHLDGLGLLTAAQELTDRYGLVAMARSLHLHRAKLSEALGDAPQALADYARYAELVVRSLRLRAEPVAQGQAASGAPGGMPLDVSAPDEPQHLRRLEPAYLRRAVQFIERQALESPRVNDVAANCGVSRRTLELAFREFKSTTVAGFITVRKMEYAAAALGRTRQSVKEVAQSIGYRSSSAFSREFRARFGVLPSAWRRSGSTTGGGTD